MELFRKNPKVSVLACFGFSILTALLQSLAYLLSYDAPEANYFSSLLLPALAFASAALGLVCIALTALSYPKGTLPAPEGLSCRKLTAAVAAAGYLAGSVCLLLSEDEPLAIVAAALAVLSAVYHVSTAVLPARLSWISVLLGTAPVVAGILFCAVYYFDNHLEMNAPLKTSAIAALLLVSVMTTGDLRILLGKATPRLYAVTAAALLGIGALVAIPVPLAFLTGLFERTVEIKTHLPLENKFMHATYLAVAPILLGAMFSAAIHLYSLFHHANQGGSEE